MYTHTRAHTHTHTYINVCACVCVCVCVYMHVKCKYLRVCMHIHKGYGPGNGTPGKYHGRSSENGGVCHILSTSLDVFPLRLFVFHGSIATVSFEDHIFRLDQFNRLILQRNSPGPLVNDFFLEIMIHQ